jgi:hypothetical protein
MTATSAASCDAVSRITPSLIGGHRKPRPLIALKKSDFISRKYNFGECI